MTINWREEGGALHARQVLDNRTMYLITVIQAHQGEWYAIVILAQTGKRSKYRGESRSQCIDWVTAYIEEQYTIQERGK
jgi:hypothetical protein